MNDKPTTEQMIVALGDPIDITGNEVDAIIARLKEADALREELRLLKLASDRYLDAGIALDARWQKLRQWAYDVGGNDDEIPRVDVKDIIETMDDLEKEGGG